MNEARFINTSLQRGAPNALSLPVIVSTISTQKSFSLKDCELAIFHRRPNCTLENPINFNVTGNLR
jgi:hypothetical protein